MRRFATNIALVAAALALLAGSLAGCRSGKDDGGHAKPAKPPADPFVADRAAFDNLIRDLTLSRERQLTDGMLESLDGLVAAGPRIEPMLLAIWDQAGSAEAMEAEAAKRKAIALAVLELVGGDKTIEHLRRAIGLEAQDHPMAHERQTCARIWGRQTVSQVIARNAGSATSSPDEILLRLTKSKGVTSQPSGRYPTRRTVFGDGLLTADEERLGGWRIASAAAQQYVRNRYPPVDFNPLARYLRDLRHIGRQDILQRISDAKDPRFVAILALELRADPARENDQTPEGRMIDVALIGALIECWSPDQPEPLRQTIIASAKELAEGSSSRDLRDQVELLLKVIKG